MPCVGAEDTSGIEGSKSGSAVPVGRDSAGFVSTGVVSAGVVSAGFVSAGFVSGGFVSGGAGVEGEPPSLLSSLLSVWPQLSQVLSESPVLAVLGSRICVH